MACDKLHPTFLQLYELFAGEHCGIPISHSFEYSCINHFKSLFAGDVLANWVLPLLVANPGFSAWKLLCISHIKRLCFWLSESCCPDSVYICVTDPVGENLQDTMIFASSLSLFIFWISISKRDWVSLDDQRVSLSSVAFPRILPVLLWSWFDYTRHVAVIARHKTCLVSEAHHRNLF